MKVTFLVANYAPSVGGAQHLVQELAEGLSARHRHDVEVITTDAIRGPMGRDPGRIATRSETLDGVVVHRYPVPRRTNRVLRLGRRAHLLPGGQSRLAVGPLGVRLLAAACRAGRRSDVVIAVTMPSTLMLAGAAGTRGTPTAFVAVPLAHVGAAAPPKWALDALRRADGCTTLTAFERGWVEDQGVRPDAIAVLPPGCHPEEYPNLDPPAARAALGLPERPTVGYVGRLAVHKGIDTLLDAAGLLWKQRPDAGLLIAGSPAGWEGFEPLLRSHLPAAGDRLVVRERFTDQERPLLLSACDVVAFPSRVESFGMVTVEAWCARRPVVVGDIPAVRSLVHEGLDGDLVETGRADLLAERILALLDEPDRRRRYGEAGRRRAEDEFGWDAIVDQWDEFLSSVATSSRRSVASRTSGA